MKKWKVVIPVIMMVYDRMLGRSVKQRMTVIDLDEVHRSVDDDGHAVWA